MKYALYWGCLIPSRELGYELAVRRVLPALGIETDDMKDTSCCIPFGVQSITYEGWLALGARNLCIAEEMGLNILALCNDCYESLAMVNKILKEEPEAKKEVNNILSEVGKEFKGKINVKHTIDVILEDVGLEKLKSMVKRPLKGLRVATHPGCHLVRPKMLHYTEMAKGFEDLDRVVKALGVEVVNYDEKEVCCGGPLRDIENDLARQVVMRKLDAIKNLGVDGIVTVCPFCYIQFDLGQLEIKSVMKKEYGIPVFHFVELLNLALGLDLTETEVKDHKIPIHPTLDKILTRG